MVKAEENWWDRLYKKSGKVAWMKTDFDKWKDEVILPHPLSPCYPNPNPNLTSPVIG